MPAKPLQHFTSGDLAPKDASGHGRERCPGCIKKPSPWCAACGKRAAWWLPVKIGLNRDSVSEHAMTLCEGCYQLVLECRGEGERQRGLPKARRLAA